MKYKYRVCKVAMESDKKELYGKTYIGEFKSMRKALKFVNKNVELWCTEYIQSQHLITLSIDIEKWKEDRMVNCETALYID